ncbi:NAD(P)-binding protein [Hypoxylon rubiginosum]|uniref:NAD(P)-binding protein n=1 Tax=Hypoxylon rubiginosum TaxID=110542 RepID=A0ACC0CJY6_9PEZI|nr:NAD(P)-binding protein [Hypoxylon rubiginosum]
MPTVLIIGAGPNVGKACAETFAAAGYKVAVASRTQKLDSKYRHYAFDASKPDTVPALFERVTADLDVPSVVIYNTYVPGTTPAGKPFEDDLNIFQKNLNINTVSVYAATREAIKGFDKLGANGLGPTGGTFIFTGNLLNIGALGGHMAFGMGKSAGAHMIQHLALVEFSDRPYKFYYADERHEDGVYMTTDLNGDAHAEAYLELAKDPKQRSWDYTFVRGKGYVEFPRWEVWPRPGID